MEFDKTRCPFTWNRGKTAQNSAREGGSGGGVNGLGMEVQGVGWWRSRGGEGLRSIVGRGTWVLVLMIRYMLVLLQNVVL